MKEANSEKGIDVRDLFEKLIKKWYYFVIAIFISLSVAYVQNRLSPKIYNVYSLLRLKTEGSSTAQEMLNTFGVQKNNKNVEDEIMVIKSVDYLKQTLALLDFNISYFSHGDIISRERYKEEFPLKVQLLDSSHFQAVGVPVYVNILSSEEFEIEIDQKEVYQYNFIEDVYLEKKMPELVFKKKYRFNESIREPFLNIRISLVGEPKMYGDDKLFFVINSPDELIKNYITVLNVEPMDEESQILYLWIDGNVVAREEEFLNTLMEVVVQNNLERKNKEYVSTINFIDFQLANISDSLYKAERAMESYQYATTSIGETNLLYAKREQFENELADLNLKINYLRNISRNLETLEGVSNISSPASVGIEDPLLTSLLIKISELNQQRIQYGRTATAANPIIQRIDLELNSTRSAMKENLQEVISSTNIAINDIQRRLRATNATLARLPGTEIRKLGIERRFEFSDNTYEMLMQRKAAAGISLATSVSDWEIIQPAMLSSNEPVSPNTLFIFLLALFVGILVPVLVVVIWDSIDTRIHEKADVERLTNIPILGSVIKGSKNLKLVTEYDSKSPLVESLRSIRTNLQFFSSNKDHKVIGFTSSASGEGKSFCTFNLGIVIAQSGKRVVIIDGDLRKPGLERYFPHASKKGLTTYLINDCQVPEILQNTKFNNLTIIPSGSVPPNPPDLLSLPKFGELINELKAHFDYILIDSPPVGLVSDYLIISKSCDINLYIVKANKTKKASLEVANDLFENNKLTNLSMILNNVESRMVYKYGYHNYYTETRKPKINSKNRKLRKTG